MDIQKNNSVKAQNVSFSGHKKYTDKAGFSNHAFYYLYDSNKYKCELELYDISKDKRKNLNVNIKEGPTQVIPMDKGAVRLELPDNNLGFAYRFKLTDTKTGKESYAFDNGTVYNIKDTDNSDNKFNIILNNRATINKNGPMQLIMPDEYNPGIQNIDGNPVLNKQLRDNALLSVRNHANKLGGNFYGIIQRLPEISKEGVKRIVGTPFTKDTISSHLYWTENAYQVAPDLGTEEDFKALQTELFKNGINWIADAALVNEGFGGIHLSELLRKGQNAESKYMFRADERISLGILPDKCDYTRMKVINAPFTISNGEYKHGNKKYDPTKPTYIQFYDDRLASKEQKESDSPLRMSTYDNKNTDNMYDITKHDDAVYPFPLEVSPSELERNIKRITTEKGVIDFSDTDTIKKVADFSNFNVVTKSENGGLEVWDGNVDIAKLNFYRNTQDDARFTKLPQEQRQEAVRQFDRGTLAVRDYAINSGKYWTGLTADTQLKYASMQLAGKASTTEDYMTVIKDLVKAGKLPASSLENIDEEVIENVLNDEYNLRTIYNADIKSPINPEFNGSNDYSYSDYILKKATDLPLETLPFATNLLGIITSPYIAKKANTEDELGVSRYDLYKAQNPNLPEKYSKVYNQADEIFAEKVTSAIEYVLSDIQGLKDENGEVTELGRYVISEITPDLTKYVLTKAVAPKAAVQIKNNGEFDFSKVNPEEITMQSLGIPYEGKTSEEEAQAVVDALYSGIDRLIENGELDNLKNIVNQRFANRNLNDFKIAEMILDRTDSGMGWRIDAAKDVASIDAVRSDHESMTKAWNQVIDFWKRYNQGVLEINPHAYTTAEITDLYALFENSDKSVFTSDADAEQKFIQETGITSVANYNYFFSLLPDLFVKNHFEDGGDGWQAKQGMNKELREKLAVGWSETNPGFLFQSPDDGVTNSYTFVGNHDKPRVLHNLALDMGLFTSDFSNEQHQNIAAKVLKKNLLPQDFDKISSKAIAMGERLDNAFADCIKNKELQDKISDAVANLASGQFKGKNFDAEAFGTRPFEIAIKSILDEAEYNGTKIAGREEIEAQVLKSILTPAYDRFYSIYKLLMTLPGSPTDFAGDRVGVTGFESKAKNYHQQNRNIIHWEWLKDDSDNKYKFMKDFYNRMNEISDLRSRKELSALNDGATVAIPLSEKTYNDKGSYDLKISENIQSMLRYNDKGSVVLTLHDLKGANVQYDSLMNREDNVVQEPSENKIILNLDSFNAKQGLKHGLDSNIVFKNARKEDNSNYKIIATDDGYCLKRFNDKGQELPILIKKEDLNTLILYKA